MTPLNKLFGVFVHYKDRFSAVSDGPWGFTRWWRPMPSRWSVVVLSWSSPPRRRSTPVLATSAWRSLYRSLRWHHLGDEVLLTARLVKEAATAVGVVAAWRMDRPRPSLGVCRRRVLIQDRRGSWCVPDRCVITDGFFPLMVTNVTRFKAF